MNICMYEAKSVCMHEVKSICQSQNLGFKEKYF